MPRYKVGKFSFNGQRPSQAVFAGEGLRSANRRQGNDRILGDIHRPGCATDHEVCVRDGEFGALPKIWP